MSLIPRPIQALACALALVLALVPALAGAADGSVYVVIKCEKFFAPGTSGGSPLGRELARVGVEFGRVGSADRVRAFIGATRTLQALFERSKLDLEAADVELDADADGAVARGKPGHRYVAPNELATSSLGRGPDPETLRALGRFMIEHAHGLTEGRILPVHLAEAEPSGLPAPPLPGGDVEAWREATREAIRRFAASWVPSRSGVLSGLAGIDGAFFSLRPGSWAFNLTTGRWVLVNPFAEPTASVQVPERVRTVGRQYSVDVNVGSPSIRRSLNEESQR